jgi:uncharacterized protein
MLIRPQGISMSQGIVRRADKVMSEQDIVSLLDTAPVAHFGSISANGDPYVVPNLFVHHDRKLLCHTSLAGHFRSNVVARPRVCFEISEMGTVFPYGEFECDSSVSYRSVVGFGAISIEEGKQEKIEFFDLFMSKYSSTSGRPKSFYPRLDQITVYSLSIETVTGKYQILPAANEIWPATNKTKTPGAKPPAS